MIYVYYVVEINQYDQSVLQINPGAVGYWFVLLSSAVCCNPSSFPPPPGLLKWLVKDLASWFHKHPKLWPRSLSLRLLCLYSVTLDENPVLSCFNKFESQTYIHLFTNPLYLKSAHLSIPTWIGKQTERLWIFFVCHLTELRGNACLRLEYRKFLEC